jgi:hypothetical protein
VLPDEVKHVVNGQSCGWSVATNQSCCITPGNINRHHAAGQFGNNIHFNVKCGKQYVPTIAAASHNRIEIINP